MSHELKEQLKPCPFCGSLPEVDLMRDFIDWQGNPGKVVAIYCSNDMCQIEMSLCQGDITNLTPEEIFTLLLKDNWNKRV